MTIKKSGKPKWFPDFGCRVMLSFLGYGKVPAAFFFTATGNSFQLLQGQILPVFLRDGDQLFRGLCGFDLFLLFVGKGVEDVLGKHKRNKSVPRTKGDKTGEI